MNENFECELYPTEPETIRNCSNIEIEAISKVPLGSGTHGIVYPALVKFGSENNVLVIKKISMEVSTEKQENDFIKDMYDEVGYSYEMGKNKIGPHVYDAFFYKTGNTVNQYILMEKFDTSVSKWLLSNNNKDILLTDKNCQFVTNAMLDLLHKQIFVLNTYCGDIKTDNFVISFVPFAVRMIDFGIDWCSNTKLPSEYGTLASIKHFSQKVKKEIFYCMCTLQLFMNIINMGTPDSVIRDTIRPFYKDAIFIKYVLKDALREELIFEKITLPPLQLRLKTKRLKRRSNKTNKITKFDFKIVVSDMLKHGSEQAILLSHYARKNNDQKDADVIVDHIFSEIKNFTKIYDTIYKRNI